MCNASAIGAGNGWKAKEDTLLRMCGEEELVEGEADTAGEEETTALFMGLKLTDLRGANLGTEPLEELGDMTPPEERRDEVASTEDTDDDDCDRDCMEMGVEPVRLLLLALSR